MSDTDDATNLPNINSFLEEIKNLREELSDLKILYENTIDHSSRIENELEGKNRRINTLLTSMKMYLSPQLYSSIVKGKFETKLRHQRKKLTMFFSDIVDFTATTDIIEPETLSRLLNEYLTEMSEIAIRYGGTIDKYIGDAIVVFFGDPEYVDDVHHARQCVCMALDMLEAIHAYSRAWSDAGALGGFSVRMGVNTGFCTVGNFGSESRMDYTIIGGQVNIASRIEKFAKPNTLYVSDSTYALVRDIVRISESSSITVKGIHYPVGIHRVAGLQRDAELRSDLLRTDGAAFDLEAIRYNPSGTPPEERRRIRDALYAAIRLLDE